MILSWFWIDENMNMCGWSLKIFYSLSSGCCMTGASQLSGVSW